MLHSVMIDSVIAVSGKMGIMRVWFAFRAGGPWLKKVFYDDC